jgi:CRP-like cAMP-binding protein
MFLHIKNKINQVCVIPDEQLKEIIPLISKASYKKNEYYTKVGDVQPYLGFVISGLFRLFYIDIKGKEYTKNFFTTDNLFSVYNSILKGKPSNLYIQALRDSEILLIDYNEWLKLTDSHISWQILLRKITEHAYLEKEKRESDLLFYDAETRYLNFKNDFPGLESQIKQHHIASFLGMSSETLSRIKKAKN